MTNLFIVALMLASPLADRVHGIYHIETEDLQQVINIFEKETGFRVPDDVEFEFSQTTFLEPDLDPANPNQEYIGMTYQDHHIKVAMIYDNLTYPSKYTNCLYVTSIWHELVHLTWWGDPNHTNEKLWYKEDGMTHKLILNGWFLCPLTERARLKDLPHSKP